MIKYSRLPEGVLNKVPELVSRLKDHDQIVAFYFFGSGSLNQLKPLSDLDFAILLNPDAAKSYDLQLEMVGVFSETLQTDEFDLVILNSAPVDFAFNIIDKGKLLLLNNQDILVDFIENTIRLYLDFQPIRRQFDQDTIELFREKYLSGE